MVKLADIDKHNLFDRRVEEIVPYESVAITRRRRWRRIETSERVVHKIVWRNEAIKFLELTRKPETKDKDINSYIKERSDKVDLRQKHSEGCQNMVKAMEKALAKERDEAIRKDEQARSEFIEE